MRAPSGSRRTACICAAVALACSSQRAGGIRTPLSTEVRAQSAAAAWSSWSYCQTSCAWPCAAVLFAANAPMGVLAQWTNSAEVLWLSALAPRCLVSITGPIVLLLNVFRRTAVEIWIRMDLARRIVSPYDRCPRRLSRQFLLWVSDTLPSIS